MHKVVIAIDTFKGCLSSIEAEKAATEGILSVFPECDIISLPVADGGEGMLDVLIAATQGKSITAYAHDPLMERRETRYGISGDGQTAFIEMANISGLPLVAVEQRNPMLTTSYGTGELIFDALERGCRNFIIGLGGSATNDAGSGMLQALGFRFLNKEGNELGNITKDNPTHPTGKVINGMCGQLISEVVSIDFSSIHPALKESHFTAACDVKNPFYGLNGAAYIFAPQKGADEKMVQELDKGLEHIANIIRKETGRDISVYPGAGAAGGMGGGMLAFLRAELKPGIELLLNALNFKEQIKGANLIITGEGKSDRQTLMGKVPFGILREAQKQHIPVILLAGSVEDCGLLSHAGFQGIFSITPSPLSLEQAMEPSFARMNIKRTVEQICRILAINDAICSK